MLTLPLGLMLALMFTHWVADFVFQSDKMALNKSQDTSDGLYYLTLHVLVYTACFFWTGSVTFLIFTAWLHWLTDYTTSRVNSKLWFLDIFTPSEVKGYLSEGEFVATFNNKRHWFFVSIGFDQFLHFFALLAGASFFL